MWFPYTLCSTGFSWARLWAFDRLAKDGILLTCLDYVILPKANFNSALRSVIWDLSHKSLYLVTLFKANLCLIQGSDVEYDCGATLIKYIYLRDQGVSCLEKNNHISDSKCTCLAQRQCPSIRVRGNFGHSSKGPMVHVSLYTTLLFCFLLPPFMSVIFINGLLVYCL